MRATWDISHAGNGALLNLDFGKRSRAARRFTEVIKCHVSLQFLRLVQTLFSTAVNLLAFDELTICCPLTAGPDHHTHNFTLDLQE